MHTRPLKREGDIWGYRERTSVLGSPLLPAEILQLGPARSNKVRVRHLDGELSGLDA